ncbi:MAG: Hsp70 family protein [Saprospiraceae bacterium]
MINFGIDLGTTNSAIAKFSNGNVEIFRNPVTLKQTLPSVVAFRKNRIQVGDKAREYLQRDPKNVVAAFKRKMGTTEKYEIASLGESKSPIDLSAEVLKELKNFIHTGEKLEAAVVTIPASFDTIQSNATKKAGEAAGFEQVVLLQEPIAASLAYANKDEDAFEEGQWLVYDLGGGTFDVALVEINDGEMKIIDHEGDNFLGGTDFDNKIVEKIILPFIEHEGQFTNLEQELKSASGKYNKLYQVLLHKAEEAKIMLSNHNSTEIEFEIEDETGELIDAYMMITRQQLEDLLSPYIKGTVDMIRQMLDRNQLATRNLKYVLMVGGSTYIPFVRQFVGESLQIEVNCNIDPTTAVAIGAAFYAGTKPKQLPKTEVIPTKSTGIQSDIQVKTAYQKTSQDDEEYFTALIQGEVEGLFYRITRQDGGFDTGLKPLQNRISEYLTLMKNAHNLFDFKVFNKKNDVINVNIAPIGITQGRYNVVGQPLPNDISIEIDDIETGSTVLEVIFEKNSILPTKRTFVKEITKTIKKDSLDKITINIVEGPGYSMPSANQTIGIISVAGSDLTRDLVKGSDIEITLEISESRDLTINAYLLLTDQEYQNVFNPSERYVEVSRLKEQLVKLLNSLNTEISDAEHNENYEVAADLNVIKKELRSLIMRLNNLRDDDVTDEKFQIEDQKRKLAQRIDNLTRDKHIIKVKMEYFATKRSAREAIENEHATEGDKQQFEQIMSREKAFLATNSRLKIQEVINQLSELRGRIYWKSPEYLISVFYYYMDKREEYKDKKRADAIIKQGEEAIEKGNYDRVKSCINQLYALLPPKIKKIIDQGGTGIG